MRSVIAFFGSSNSPRLSPDEIDALVRFAYSVHDHQAATPAQPIFWLRTEGDLSQFWN